MTLWSQSNVPCADPKGPVHCREQRLWSTRSVGLSVPHGEALSSSPLPTVCPFSLESVLSRRHSSSSAPTHLAYRARTTLQSLPSDSTKGDCAQGHPVCPPHGPVLRHRTARPHGRDVPQRRDDVKTRSSAAPSSPTPSAQGRPSPWFLPTPDLCAVTDKSPPARRRHSTSRKPLPLPLTRYPSTTPLSCVDGRAGHASW